MTAQNDRRLNHEYMPQPGRLRRPGRGLKTIEINQLTIQKTASHTEILTLPWQKLDSFPHESSINIPWQRSPHIISTPSWLGVMMPNGILYGVDLKTEKLSRRANNSFSARDLISLGGDSILLKGVRFATTFLISDDLGQTWTELPLSRFPGFVAAKDRRNLFALTSEGGVSGGQIQMKGSRDGGVTWSVTGTPPTKPGWVSIVGMQIDKYDGSLLLFYKDGNRMRSQDEGKTWSAD